MKTMEYLRSFAQNPQNPKNIQLPFITFLAIEAIVGAMDKKNLTSEGREVFDFVLTEIVNKKSSIRNRQAFSEIIHAGENKTDKQAALQNYIATKKLGEMGV